MTQHTPGPWREIHVHGEWWVIEDALKMRVAMTSESIPEVEAANARLIAAAPEMLALIQGLAGAFDATGIPGSTRVATLRQGARTLLARIEGKE